MPIVPDDPSALFTQFLPKLFADLASASGSGETAAGGAGASTRARARSAPAEVGVLVRVVGAGEWTLRIVGGALSVNAGAAADVAMQLTLAAGDFGSLVVDPLRRGLAERSTAANAANAFWLRLGRWDAETVDLLRRQTGRILVRVDDAGTVRKLALTPGSQPHSLETAECCIDCSLADLLELQTKRKNPLDLFYSGQVRIVGDAQVALAMAGLFL